MKISSAKPVKGYTGLSSTQRKKLTAQLDTDPDDDVFDRIESTLNVYHYIFEGDKNAPNPAVLRKHIDALRNTAKNFSGQFRTLYPYLDPLRKDGLDELRARLLPDITTLISLLEKGRKRVREGRGRPKNLAREYLLQDLAEIYVQYNPAPKSGRTRKRKGTVTRNPNSGKYTGGFIEFVETCLGPKHSYSNAALGKAIQRAFETDKN